MYFKNFLFRLLNITHSIAHEVVLSHRDDAFLFYLSRIVHTYKAVIYVVHGNLQIHIHYNIA